MTEQNDEKLRQLLRSALPPVADRELARELWPRMLEKLNERAFRVVWFEWALIALLAVLVFFFPEVIPALLYHL